MAEKVQNVTATTVQGGESRSDGRAGGAELAAIREMVESAQDRVLAVTGPDGLLKLLTATVLETALEEEMNDHLGTRSTPLKVVTVGTPATAPAPGL